MQLIKQLPQADILGLEDTAPSNSEDPQKETVDRGVQTVAARTVAPQEGENKSSAASEEEQQFHEAEGRLAQLKRDTELAGELLRDKKAQLITGVKLEVLLNVHYFFLTGVRLMSIAPSCLRFCEF